MNFSSRKDFEDFMYRLLEIVPSDSLPEEVVLPDDDFFNVEASRQMGFQTPSRLIPIRKRSEWLAERKYREEIKKLKKRIEELETPRKGVEL